jgi:hypothetical protein
MSGTFRLEPGESILYHSSLPRKWYDLAWRIGLEVFEVAISILFSITALTNLAGTILATFLSTDLAYLLGRILFQGMAPLLIVIWFAEDTARIFTSELILTNQRLWTSGSPFAWSRGQDTPLSDVRFMSSRSDTLFIYMRSTKKTRVQALMDGKEIVKAFTQFTGKTGPGTWQG